MDIGKKLEKYRENLQLTQNKVANKLCVSRQTISNWERGVSYPDLESIVKLSNLYQKTIDELLK